jgi:iron complex outermembrane receptor protein
LRRTLESIVRFVCLIVLGTVVAAQPGSRLTGVVRDTTGSVLPGVSVTVTGAALIAPRTVVTDERGEYVVDTLPAGRHLVTAAFSGFAPSSTEIEVGVTTATLNVVLQVSSFAERMTVTATKTGAADVQSTPVAVTVLAATALEQMGVQTVEGLAGVVPTVTISQHTGLAQVTIRGIGTNSTFGDPSSTVHLDGVYLGRPAMVFADFLNVERVEVLRGPQGTLYGRNSVGGSINIVSRQPTNTLETSVRLTAGNYHKLRAEGAVSGPLIKNKVMGNFAILRGTRDGFVKDLDHPDHSLGSEDTWAGRGQLRIVLGTHGELLLSGDRGQYEGVPLTYAKPLVAKPGFVDRFDNPPGLWRVRTSDVTSGKNIQQGASAKLTVRLNRTTTLTSLTAYRRSHYRFFIDADATELQVQTSDVPDVQRQVSQELTLVQRTSKLTWIGGGFLFDEHYDGQVAITNHDAGLQIRPFAKVGVKARALFGQATYNVSSRVSLTGGLRYTDERKDLHNTGGTYPLGAVTPLSSYDYLADATYRAWTPKASIQMEVSRDTFVYASATRGFKSGGFNQFNPTAPESERAFNPEFAWSFEGGLKRTMAGGRVRLNTAVFSNDYRDLQVQSFLRPGVIDVSNAGSATIRGIEVEAAAAGRGVQLAGHFSWLDASYNRHLFRGSGSVTLDAAGNRLNNAPEWSGSISAGYRRATGGAGTASVRSEVSWQSRVFFTPVNDADETQRAYALAHIRAGFEPRSRRWEIAVYVRNLGNQEYITGTANVPLPAITGRPGEPRHWGTQLTIRR